MTLTYLPSAKITFTNLFLQVDCLIVASIGLIFGYWFAHAQVAAVAPNALANYPASFMALTILKCTLTIMAGYAVIKWVFSNIVVNKYSPIVLALSFLPLVLVFANTSLLQCLELIILVQMCYLLALLRLNDYQVLGKRYSIDFLALVGFLVLHLFLTTTYSPLHLNMALLTSIGYYGEETYILAPIFKGFILAKQFSFTNIDHSQWAGIMNPPITLASPFMQLIALIFDLPSISYPAFHQDLMIVSFILMVLGSFGFYLFLNFGIKVNKLFSFWGGCLFFFSGAPLTFDMFLRDGGVFLSPYAVFPYALLLITYAFSKNDGRYAAGAGIALAAQFFFLTPHPEGVIFSLLFYGVYVSGLVLSAPNEKFLRKIQLASLSIALFFVLSSYVFMPILVDRFMGNMYVFAHTGDLEMVHLATFNRYITIGLISLVIALTSLWKRKQFTPAFLSIIFLALALFGLILITTSLADITYLMHKLHIGLHFWYYWRIGMYFSMTVFVITIVALQEITDFIFCLIERRVINDARLRNKMC
jgi:hypothetical protein